MKLISGYFFVIISILFIHYESYGQTEIKIKHGPRSEKNLLDAEGLPTGPWKEYNQYGELLRSVEYVHGKKEGLTTIYYRSEEPVVKEEINYFDGIKDGAYSKKFFTGETAIEGEYKMGKKHAKWTYYFDNGEVKKECNFDNGIKDGLWKSFNKKGELKKETTYKAGVDMSAPAKVEPPKAAGKGKPGAKPAAGAAAPAAADKAAEKPADKPADKPAETPAAAPTTEQKKD